MKNSISLKSSIKRKWLAYRKNTTSSKRYLPKGLLELKISQKSKNWLKSRKKWISKSIFTTKKFNMPIKLSSTSIWNFQITRTIMICLDQMMNQTKNRFFSKVTLWTVLFKVLWNWEKWAIELIQKVLNKSQAIESKRLILQKWQKIRMTVHQ